ncbi:MAG TPA: biopolymer transporter ExbD [Acidobacteriota bacterium]|jgi:biopolymer transport protein ExbD|nr:biopolymer transporter ExbD [Acidobacteriota bacterium]HNR40019.1 biopolymer transporter ExbD [Acidobacteriota bacterium]HOB51229.1 biopolymer transporter ExbD [Acidobacteriota bacterium]HPB26684.1 biopolymer transporter ExbD [Acidobacteriota bacterium]HQG91270.1 biopolymer transporter ExbD [Acidobacteriota bacterium]
MGMAVGGGGGPKSDINVTPYIDILLVLLIIFMVITPFTPHGLDVRVPEKLPPEVTQEIADRFQGIVVSLNTDGSMFINKDPVTFDSLSQRLTQIYSARADKSIFIKGAKGLIYGDIVKAIDIAKGAGVEQIGLMTELE